MSTSKKINNSTLRLEKGDITDMELEAFVFYAQSDLALGSGFGNAISMRGGLAIKKELESIGSLEDGKAVVTGAGEMKATHIVHAVGPKFQEENIESKLETTMINTLKTADEKGIKQLAFPPMGANFYGIPLPDCARIMVKTITEHLKGKSGLKDVLIIPMDNREFKPFEKALNS
ncbi:MAG: O-acetyl-ADP-ribose deacetylase [Calditrichaeota bacterium]|jgi:O-acetyl-ADP-ribose deacetylase|nr:O-acetyl-ADP-ribose deacetylase [Calditrichota bacterium]MBT7619313.1 O-acetyl-ADP-ribose deacetylase [Calditrichota bacterium]MBT7787881.1 O-acetyl-ADP-ribose deacetylase [Calditrichota bacterium]